MKINLNAIDARLEALASRKKNKPYEKQKSSLAVEFDNFLFSLPTPKTIMSALPSDITRFLAYKDKGGRTKVHRPACQYFGVTGPSSCNCPKRLAAKPFFQRKVNICTSATFSRFIKIPFAIISDFTYFK